MKENEFKEWLQARGAQTEAGRNSRTHAVRTIERQLERLGSQHSNLDQEFAKDGFQQLRERLKAIRIDAKAGGQDYRILMPDSDNPLNRLSNWNSWLAQYGQFLSGERNDSMSQADRIRLYVAEHYIEPAREEGRDTVDILVRDVNEALGLNQAWPNICQAISGKKMREMAQVSVLKRIGVEKSSATIFRFDLTDAPLSDDEIFARFERGRPSFAKARRTWSADEAASFCELARAVHAAGLDWWHVNIAPYQLRYGRTEKGRDRASAALGMIYKTSPEITMGGSRGFGSGAVLSLRDDPASELEEVLEKSADQIASEYAPASPRKGYWPDELGMEEANGIAELRGGELVPNQPTNLILYGPPGTGKTYATAEEAVRLCGEAPPTDRRELMVRYKQLCDAQRIEFVTFHQSMSYEDFVEGRRPVTSGSEEGSGAGFELETFPGVFRRISALAEQAAEMPASAKPFDFGNRQVFKMSLGRAGSEDHIYEAAIDGGYIVLGWGGDIDWTPYSTYEAIHAKWNELNPGTNGNDPNIVQTTRFRVDMKEGDLVVISSGNHKFRAIAEVTGPYQFEPSEHGNMRRAVRWLRVFDAPLPVETIYDRPFIQWSCYRLATKNLNREALIQLLPGEGGNVESAERQFVLIIDEINRANISKVFGELITLIEPDKRLGQANELRVKLPYSEDRFGVPSNLNILGTMNTADRSIALLDTALRRRFDFRELMPKPELLGVVDGINLGKLLSTINERVEYLFDREHQIGHAYLIGCKSRLQIDGVIRNKIIPLLSEYFYEDWSKIAAILGDSASHDGEINGGFLNRRPLVPPPGFDGDGEFAVRHRWSVREESFDYSRLLGA